ncbi:MAG: protease modulator HflC [bacterium]
MKKKSVFKRVLTWSILVVAILVAGNMILYTVDETEYVVVTRFGNPVRANLRPGLKIKWPEPIENIYRYDNRLLTYPMGEIEFLPRDKKNIMVDTYVVWRIVEPIQFLKTVKNKLGAEERLRDIVSSDLGIAIGRYDLASLIAVEKHRIKLGEMLKGITQATDSKVGDYGMKVDDIRIKVLNFPLKNLPSVYRRMRAERERIARKYRSQGSGEAERIRAEADKEVEKIISEAYEAAQRIRGEGDAEAIRIYADAYKQDPRFYELIRTLEAYVKLIDKQTTVVLPADAELLKFLNSPGSRLSSGKK